MEKREWSDLFTADLAVADPEIARLIAAQERQNRATVNLVASETYCPAATLAAETSELVNKTSRLRTSYFSIVERYAGVTVPWPRCEVKALRRSFFLFCHPKRDPPETNKILGDPRASFARPSLSRLEKTPKRKERPP